MRRFIRITLFAASLSSSAIAQETPRQIFDSYFAKTRPPAPSSTAAPKPEYRVTEPNPRASTSHSAALPAGAVKKAGAATPGGAALGVTIWRLQPAAPGDGARLLVQASGNAKRESTPHRIEAGDRLHKDDQFRFAVEAPSGGYLYVVDQEVSKDGTLGPPYLIFPTERMLGGNNKVTAGQIVELPAQSDETPVLTIDTKRPTYAGEHLTFVVTPRPIPGLTVGPKEQLLPRKTFEAWLSEYQSSFRQYELVGGKGQAWTRSEQQAGADRSRLLTQADPPPQTVFFFPERAGKPVMAAVDLRIEE